MKKNKKIIAIVTILLSTGVILAMKKNTNLVSPAPMTMPIDTVTNKPIAIGASFSRSKVAQNSAAAKAATRALSEEMQQVDAKLQSQVAELKAEFAASQEKAATMNPAAQEKEKRRLQTKERSLQDDFAEADSMFKQKEQQLVADVIGGIEAAAADMGAKNGFAVLETDTGRVLYGGSELDISDQLIAKVDQPFYEAQKQAASMTIKK